MKGKAYEDDDSKYKAFMKVDEGTSFGVFDIIVSCYGLEWGSKAVPDLILRKFSDESESGLFEKLDEWYELPFERKFSIRATD